MLQFKQDSKEFSLRLLDREAPSNTQNTFETQNTFRTQITAYPQNTHNLKRLYHSVLRLDATRKKGLMENRSYSKKIA